MEKFTNTMTLLLSAISTVSLKFVLDIVLLSRQIIFIYFLFLFACSFLCDFICRLKFTRINLKLFSI